MCESLRIDEDGTRKMKVVTRGISRGTYKHLILLIDVISLAFRLEYPDSSLGRAL